MYKFFNDIKISDCLLLDFALKCDEILNLSPIDYDTTTIVLSRNLANSILLRDNDKFNQNVAYLSDKKLLEDDKLIESFLYRVMAYIKFKSSTYDILQKYDLVANYDQDHNHDFILFYDVLLARGINDGDDELLYYYLLTFLNRYINNDYNTLAEYIIIIEEIMNIDPIDTIYYSIDNVKNNERIKFKDDMGYGITF